MRGNGRCMIWALDDDDQSVIDGATRIKVGVLGVIKSPVRRNCAAAMSSLL